MVFQNYALYPHMTVAANMGFSHASCATRRNREIDERVQGRRRHPGSHAAARALSPPALGRPAPARRHGPRHRPRPAGVPVRRAAVQSRCQAACADAHRDQGAASAHRDHHHLRHPRPDRSHDHGRQDRRHARRPGRADRRAARPLRLSRQPVRRRLHRLAGHELSARQNRRNGRRLRGSGRRRACRWLRRPTARAAGPPSTGSGPSTLRSPTTARRP